MKKVILLLVVALVTLTSCSAGADNSPKYSVGSYAITSDIADRNKVDGEKVQLTTLLASVVMADKKIVNVNIDASQLDVAIDETGEVTLPLETPTKKEKKNAYGMAGASSIGKEWFEQVQALETALVGKTLEEVQNFDLKEDGTVADADLLSSVTLSVSAFLEVVIKAMEVAVEVEGTVAKVGTSVITTLGDSAASEDKNGSVTFNTHFGHIALDKDGKILQAFIDVAQNVVSYNAKGEWQDFTPRVSKKVLKEDYGMVIASQIGKEWYEQAEFLENWMIGQTINEVNGVAKDDTGAPADEKLVSGVTVTITDYLAVFTKAANNSVDVK